MTRETRSTAEQNDGQPNLKQRLIDAHEQYAPGAHRRILPYAALSTVYGSAVIGLATAIRRSGRTLPETVGPWDLTLISVATHRLSRTIAKDKVTSFVRAPFMQYEGPSSAAEVKEKPRGTGMQRAIGELLGCPFCLAQWTATGFTYGLILAPRATRLVAGAFSAVSIADFLQYAYAGAQKVVEN